MATLRISKINPAALVPKYASAGAAGMDLSACIPGPMVIKKGSTAVVPTGLVIALPASHEGQVRPRSGLAAKHGVTVLNAPGTIDEDYRGQVCVLLVNLGEDDYAVQPGERIAQLVVAPIARVAIEEAPDIELLGETTRGASGFGSTGKH